jgi:hypothetical protein
MARRSGGRFINLILPHVFGERGRLLGELHSRPEIHDAVGHAGHQLLDLTPQVADLAPQLAVHRADQSFEVLATPTQQTRSDYWPR